MPELDLISDPTRGEDADVSSDVHHAWLHRFSIKPRHLPAYLELWPEEVALRTAFGFTVRRAFVQEHAEPKLTYLYEHPDPQAPQSYETAPQVRALRERASRHVFSNTLVRPVRVELVADPVRTDPATIAVLRRYSIVGSWNDFLATWRQIVPLRERYGFRCLFAVSDVPKDMFTWAFTFDGPWESYESAQRPYYLDPERAALRHVFNHMADYTVDPARILV